MSFLLRPQPMETPVILLTDLMCNSNFNQLHVSQGILIPLLPFGLDVSQTKKMFTPFLRVSPEIVPPCREPTISGDTIGARARATTLRRLCGAANYATCNAPASRRDGALLAYGTSSPRHSLRRRRTCKRGIRPCASFGWAAPAPEKRTSCIRTLRTSERRAQRRSK